MVVTFFNNQQSYFIMLFASTYVFIVREPHIQPGNKNLSVFHQQISPLSTSFNCFVVVVLLLLCLWFDCHYFLWCVRARSCVFFCMRACVVGLFDTHYS